MPRVSAVRLHASNVARAPDLAARAQWEQAAREVLVEDDLEPDAAGGPFVVELRFEGHLAQVTLLAPGEERVAAYRWDLRPLRDLLKEYLGLWRRLESLRGDGPAAQWEAIDIAKRAVHDEAAGLIAESLASLRPGLETARRLFTLLALMNLELGDAESGA